MLRPILINLLQARLNGPFFADCPSLTTVNIGANVESIPKYLFYGVTSLTTVNFAGATPKIGTDAFKGCAVNLDTELAPPVSSSKPVSSRVPASSSSKVSSTTVSSKVDDVSSVEADTEPSSVVVLPVSSDTEQGDGGINIIYIWIAAGAAIFLLAGVTVFLLVDKK